MRNLLVIVVLGLGVAAACEQRPVAMPPFGLTNDRQVLAGQPGPGLVVNVESPIPDVPIAIGFRPLPAQCSADVVGAGGVRRVRHVYQGMGHAGEVVAFYRQHLPRQGWQLAGIRSDPTADAILAYAKGPEEMQVRVRGGGVSTITIDIYPRGDSPTPSTGTAAP